MSRVSIKDIAGNTIFKGKYAITKTSGFTEVLDEITFLNYMDRKGYILVLINIDRYIFRRKGLI